ncbi:MAG TPA: lysophospholipid acyltransferase family protein [Opitutaceae bacterium]|nr:lysophospholipid acyltransferase family protein [Opitutaceae bacterium]
MPDLHAQPPTGVTAPARPPFTLRRRLRAGWRLCALGGGFLCGALLFVLTTGPWAGFRRRSIWLQRTCRIVLRTLNVSYSVEGAALPRTGVVASNHVSYVDILVLAAATPQVFLAKAEVRDWPVFNWFARMAGTQFIDRNRRSDVARQNADFVHIVENDAVLTVFLEGTSTDGSTVRPFRSSLLEPAIEHRWPVTPAAIHYTCTGGDVAQDVCWWGDMGFFEHLFRLVRTDAVTAHVRFGAPVASAEERKALAAHLHGEVVALKNQLSTTAGRSA